MIRLDELAGRLSASLLSDALDAVGRRDQVMRADIRRWAGPELLVGRAATILASDQVEVDGEPYARQIEAMDALRPDDVVVATTGGSTRCAFWGELFSTAALARGARGAIVDGLVRDVRAIDAAGFPVFATGARPIDSMGRLTVYAHGVPVRCGDVVVSPGDLVFAERDGVVVVPAEVETEVIGAALEKSGREDGMRDELRSGTSLAEAWRRHRVL